MSQFLDARRRMIKTTGDAVTLRRLIRQGSPIDVAVIGYLSAYSDREIGQGGVEQGDAKLAILNDEIADAIWPAPPRAGDVVLIDGRSWRVLGAAEAVVCDERIGWNLFIRGG